MTEEEVKTQWCPKLQLSFTPDGNILTNRGDIVHPDDIENVVSCIASECMWWVWDQERTCKTSGHCGAVKC